MSLKSYLDPIAAFEKWLKVNQKGGIFVWKGQRFKVAKISNQ
jgi:hypothetical protein